VSDIIDCITVKIIISFFSGGAAGQMSYPVNPNMAATLGGADEEDEFLSSRAEAKRAHAERMSQLRQTDTRGNHEAVEEREEAQPKQTAFQIAVSVANAADQKVRLYNL
jgi:hypothetical protein